MQSFYEFIYLIISFIINLEYLENEKISLIQADRHFYVLALTKFFYNFFHTKITRHFLNINLTK